jgi:hypothetical protein
LKEGRVDTMAKYTEADWEQIRINLMDLSKETVIDMLICDMRNISLFAEEYEKELSKGV